MVVVEVVVGFVVVEVVVVEVVVGFVVVEVVVVEVVVGFVVVEVVVVEVVVGFVGVQPGIGKYEGMIGALLCESEDGVIKVSVGSGLKDDDRLTDVYTGKIISVKYNERITNKAGEQSLFLPIFHQLREDKDVADMSTMIK